MTPAFTVTAELVDVEVWRSTWVSDNTGDSLLTVLQLNGFF